MSTSEMHHESSPSNRAGQSPVSRAGSPPDDDERPSDAGSRSGRRRAVTMPVSDDGTGRSLELPAETGSVPLARRQVRRTVASLISLDRLDASFVDALTADLELAVSELVTNAVEHAAGSSVEVRVGSDGNTVTLEVVSHGHVDQVDPVGPSHDWQVADAGSVTGRGLGIVRAVSDRVSAHHDADTLTIRVERDLPI